LDICPYHRADWQYVQLFLEEERERELETLYESGIADAMNRADGPIGTGDGAGIETQAETTGVTKQTAETLMAGERIIEALDIADAERATILQYEQEKARLTSEDAIKLQPPPKHPVLAAYNLEPEAHVLRVVEKVQNTALQDALLVLPFGKVVSLMGYLNIWAQRVGWTLLSRDWLTDSMSQGWNIILVSHITFFLLKIHHHQIVANRIMRTSLIPLRKHLRDALRQHKEVLGYNLAALQHIRRRNELQRTAQFYEEELDEEKVRARIAEGKKRKRVSLKA
jgi:U3 small nucleolar RNA-associated protein 12